MSGGWKSFRLEPHDVLFFRDGKPSNIGADHYLRSLFPPYPSTLYGAVRTRRLLDAGVDLKDLKESNWRQRLGPLAEELGGWGGFGSLKLRGPWLLQCDRPLTPAPADLGLTFKSALQRKDDRPMSLHHFNPQPRIRIGSVVSPEDSARVRREATRVRPEIDDGQMNGKTRGFLQCPERAMERLAPSSTGRARPPEAVRSHIAAPCVASSRRAALATIR